MTDGGSAGKQAELTFVSQTRGPDHDASFLLEHEGVFSENNPNPKELCVKGFNLAFSAELKARYFATF